MNNNSILNKIKPFIILHAIVLIYSLSSICSKTAANSQFLSCKFIFFCGLVVFFLGIYAFFWQQVLKLLPLNTAFANKSVTIVWGMVFGILFFKEQLSLNMIIGAVIVIIGVILSVSSEGGKHNE